MKIICNFYKDCDILYCNHKYEHENIINCHINQKCASTGEIVKCVNTRIYKLKKINENNL
jgi:hypothetical protein